MIHKSSGKVGSSLAQTDCVHLVIMACIGVMARGGGGSKEVLSTLPLKFVIS